MFSRDEKDNPGPVVCRRAPDTDWPDSSSTTPARISPCSKRTRYSAGRRLNSYRCQSITLGACPSPEIQTRTRLNSFPASGTSAFPSTSVVRSIRGEFVSVRPQYVTIIRAPANAWPSAAATTLSRRCVATIVSCVEASVPACANKTGDIPLVGAAVWFAERSFALVAGRFPVCHNNWATTAIATTPPAAPSAMRALNHAISRRASLIIAVTAAGTLALPGLASVLMTLPSPSGAARKE